jgi:hypothetical protein
MIFSDSLTTGGQHRRNNASRRLAIYRGNSIFMAPVASST